MNIIKLNQVLFLTNTVHLSQLQSELSTINITMPQTTSESKVISTYQSEYQALLNIIQQYSALLAQDIAQIKASRDSLAEQDGILSKLYVK